MIFSSYSLLILSNCALPWQTGREGDMLPVTYREVGKRQAKKTSSYFYFLREKVLCGGKKNN